MSDELHSLLRHNIAHNGANRYQLSPLDPGHLLYHLLLNRQHIRVSLLPYRTRDFGQFLDIILRGEPLMQFFELGGPQQRHIHHRIVVFEYEGLRGFELFVVGAGLDDLHVGEVLDEGGHEVLVDLVLGEELGEDCEELLFGAVVLFQVDLF